MNTLDHLADLAGIEPDYYDIWGNRHVIAADAKGRILEALGLSAGDENEVAASVESLTAESWRRRLPPVATFRIGERPAALLTFPAEQAGSRIGAAVIEETGGYHEFAFDLGEAMPCESRSVDGREFRRFRMPLPISLPLGYHTLQLEGSEADTMRLIVAPSACYLPPSLDHRGRQWGISAQLYTLKGRNDWGIGDFADLSDLVDLSARLGAAVIGLNPLHALFTQQPGRASPYSPSSRLFVNPLYLNIESLPDFAGCEEAHRLVESHRDRLDALTGDSIVDYQDVTRFKIQVMEAVYRQFLLHQRDGGGARYEGFRSFCRASGERLFRFAVFEALCEQFGQAPWQEWPEAYRDPASDAVRAFANEHEERVDFFRYLQWQADHQLESVQARAKSQGVSVGLYRDLAVGCALDGADAWSEQDVIVQRAKVGCPPDPFNLLGQDWGVPPMHPLVLRQAGYEPFAAMIRANMRHAGAIRIDHAMGLLHLFWIPADGIPADGAYVRYPFDDLLAVLALESHRNRCLVVGEDLGTVPAGFRERMAAERVLSYRLLYFEKDGDRFKRPDEYPGLSLACITTHDLATLTGFWQGADLDLKHRLKLFPTEQAEQGERAARSRDRQSLLEALEGEGILPAGRSNGEPHDKAMDPELSAALHRYLARSDASLLLVQIDDLTEELEQINVPGTVDERPNWRRRLSRPVEEIVSSPVMQALAPHLAERSQAMSLEGPLLQRVLGQTAE